jgi:hypothetical protein
MSYQSLGVSPCRGGALSPLFRKRRCCDCCGKRSEPARKPHQEAHRRSVTLINRSGVAGNHHLALKIFALFEIPLTVYRRMPLGSGAGLQDHCHVGSIYRLLRRHERRHIHRPRHRRLLVPLLGPPSLVAYLEGLPGSPSALALACFGCNPYRRSDCGSSAAFVRDAPFSGASSAALQNPGLPKRIRMRISNEPSTWAMMLLGFAGISFMAYRRKRNGPGV